jgi:hypothetical protein
MVVDDHLILHFFHEDSGRKEMEGGEKAKGDVGSQPWSLPVIHRSRKRVRTAPFSG